MSRLLRVVHEACAAIDKVNIRTSQSQRPQFLVMDGESRRVRDSDLDDDGHIIDMADRENMTLPATRKSSRASLAPTRGILKASNFDGDYTLPVDIHSANTSRKRRVSFAPQPTTHNL
jgi:hypothetical protein